MNTTTHPGPEQAYTSGPSTDAADAVDPSRCPLCGGANSCAMVAGDGQAVACWCRSVAIAPEVQAQIPTAQRGRACICARCATQAGQAGSPGGAG